MFWRECEGEEAKAQEPVWEFRYSRSPVLAASTTGYIHENLNVRPDGTFSAEILVLNEDPLPDGTVVEGATTAEPGRVLTRWNREAFEWAWYVPNFRILANGHLLTVSAGLSLAHASEFNSSVGELMMGRGLEENYLAFLAEETAEIQGLSIPISEPSVVSVRVGEDGVVDAPVVFAQASPIDGDAIRSVSSAAGKRILVASAGSLTDETFYAEGMEPFTIGRRADGGNLEGFTSKTLMPIEGGELIWVTRGWSNTFRVRPYSASGGVVFRLDGASLDTLKDNILSRASSRSEAKRSW